MSSPLKLDLNKSAAALVLSLTKRGIISPPQMDAAFLMDVSGSFKDEHEDGSTNMLITRLLPWAMVFDPDKKIDAFTFSNREGRAHYVGEMTGANHEGFVRRQIIGKVPGWCQGTEYSYAIEKALQHFGWMPQPAGVAPKVKKPGFLSRMLGASSAQPAIATPVTSQRRSMVNLITDGENDDKERTMQVLQASQDRGDLVYFNFIAYANGGGRFEFLHQIADRFDNTGLVVISDLNAFCDRDDEAVNNDMISDELVAWLKK